MAVVGLNDSCHAVHDKHLNLPCMTQLLSQSSDVISVLTAIMSSHHILPQFTSPHLASASPHHISPRLNLPRLALFCLTAPPLILLAHCMLNIRHVQPQSAVFRFISNEQVCTFATAVCNAWDNLASLGFPCCADSVVAVGVYISCTTTPHKWHHKGASVPIKSKRAWPNPTACSSSHNTVTTAALPTIRAVRQVVAISFT